MYSKKRMFDLSVAVPAVILLSLFWAVALLLVLIVDRHAPVFVQRRSGLGGGGFPMLKIKSMRGGRITPLGHLLRKTSVDETLQFINVVRGEMSIVGPRPETVENVDRYVTDHEGYRERLSVKPGITGSWQLSPSRKSVPIPERVQSDLWYIEHASFQLDFTIMLRSPMAMLRGE
jgi:lipopolysaccharide/colanic/teichoic acid biosynthesis glycosyltransferase